MLCCRILLCHRFDAIIACGGCSFRFSIRSLRQQLSDIAKAEMGKASVAGLDICLT